MLSTAGPPGRSIPIISVVAATLKGGIGKDNKVPWSILEDYKYFSYVLGKINGQNESKEENIRNVMVVGKNTWFSLPPKFRPLPDLTTFLISGSLKKGVEEFMAERKGGVVQSGEKILKLVGLEEFAKSKQDLDFEKLFDEIVVLCSSLDDAVNLANSEKWKHKVGRIVISGGASLYNEVHERMLADQVHLTRVLGGASTDVAIDPDLVTKKYDCVSISSSRVSKDKQHAYDYTVWEQKKGQSDSSPEKDDCHVGTDEGDSSAAPQDSKCKPAVLPKYAFTEFLNRFPNFRREPDFVLSRDCELTKSHFPAMHVGKHEEFQYLSIMKDIIKNGIPQNDRTGVGTLTKWGVQMRYNLSDGTFPLMTTKRVYWKGVVEELLWFIKGSTDAKILSDKNVNIWDGNGSRAFLDSRGLQHREVGDLGPVYGFQWRHFGAKYKTCHDNYENEGVDQIKDLINLIKCDPQSRRLMISAWNPAALAEMALPPCHVLSQFFVDTASGELSSIMFQRSADWALGVPFNVASYSLLTLLIAQVCGLKAKEFVHVIGNAHVYLNHVESLQTQLNRLPRPFPIVSLNPEVRDIDKFTAEDIKLVAYEPHPAIKMDMAV